MTDYRRFCGRTAALRSSARRLRSPPKSAPWRCDRSNQVSPNQNAFIERFNRIFREEVLDQYLFARVEDVREATNWWMIDYRFSCLSAQWGWEYPNKQKLEPSSF
ncbi:integrase core domain-containing protein [Xanthomonas sp. 60]